MQTYPCFTKEAASTSVQQRRRPSTVEGTQVKVGRWYEEDRALLLEIEGNEKMQRYSDGAVVLSAHPMQL